MSNPKAVIFGCQTTRLLPEEKAFFQRTNPLGFILFARNCESVEQIQELVYHLRQSINRPDAPILIDQEGGRVARLTPPNWRAAPLREHLALWLKKIRKRQVGAPRQTHGL